MKTFKDLVNEVAQPLSQGEKNFKELHGSVEAVNRNMIPGITDQDHIFKGNPRREDPKTASYEDQSDSEAQYDKTLKVAESVEDIEEEYKDPDKHYAKQSKKMQDAINLHLRKGKSYWEAVRASKVHVKEGWVALGPASKPGEKPKPTFNNLGNPNPGTKIYGEMPKMKASGRGNRSATDIKGMREETINEKTLTTAEMKKREEIVKAIKRSNKGMDKSMAYAIATKTAKRVTEDYDMDYEGEMAKAELNAIADKAAILADMLDNDTQLEAWLQSKITKAKYMIDSVHDYMMYTDHEADNNNAPSQSDAMASNYGSFLNRMGESLKEEKQYIEVTSKTGAKRYVEVHPSKAFAALNKHKATGNKARIVSKSQMKEEIELEEGVVDVYAHERNDKSSKIQDWSRAKLDKHRKIPHGSYSRKDIEDEHKRRIRTSEYEMRSKAPVKEETEQLDEISQEKKDKYVMRASGEHRMANTARRSTEPGTKEHNFWKRKEMNRKKGISRAMGEELELDEEKKQHIVNVTVTSPHHTMISKQKEKIQKRATVTAADRDTAIDTAIKHYRKQGFKVHDHVYVGLKEELELDEARRGRPRKDGSKPEGDEEGGREHIVMQLRKVVNLRGQKPVEFNDNSKHDISVEHAKKALAKHDSMHKAADKQAYAERLAKSHGSFKSAVSEAVDPTTMKSDRGDVKPFVRQDATGKFVVGKRREGHKELSVDAKMNEELKGNQHKIDANKNGKIDSHDFKLLKGKKKVEEELKGNQHKIDANKNGKVDAHDFKLLKHKKKMLESVKDNMAQDSVDKIKKDPLASKEKIVLPPTQGNKPVGGEDQVHTGKFSVAEETALNNLYESLSDKNKARFEEKMQTEEGIEELLAFAIEQGF